jgi:hypothetical protein
MADSFLYCWTDTATNMLYVGTHKGDVNDGYVCSGKLMLEQYKKRAHDFARQIIAKGSYGDMIKLETLILKSINAAKDSIFYNQHNGDGKFFNKGHTEKTKTKFKKSWSQRDKTNLFKSEIPLVTIRKKQSESAKKRVLTEEGKLHLKKIGAITTEKRKNDLEYKKQMSLSTKQIWEKRKKGLLPMPIYKKINND